MEYATFGIKKKWGMDKFLSVLLSVMFVFCLAMFSFNIFFFQMRVEGSSMEPTYCADGSDIVVVSRYYNLQRSDIVIIRTADSDIVKRVIAIGGDTLCLVLVKHLDSQYCHYTVNGEVIDESYLGDNYKDMSVSYFNKFCSLDHVTVSLGVEESIATLYIRQNEVFALGDNRRVSKDSTRYGPFLTTSILGKVVSTYKVAPLTQ